MKIVFLPPSLVGSPYMLCLRAGLAKIGVIPFQGRPRQDLPRLLAGSGPRLLHLHFFDQIVQHPKQSQTIIRSLGFLGLLSLMRLRGVRLIWTAHNLMPHELYYPNWARFVYRRVAEWSSATIAHSEAARQLLIQEYQPRHCIMIPHGSYVGYYGPIPDRAISRQQLGFPAQERITLCFGAVRPYKGIEDLIEAFGKLPVEERGRLLIAGSSSNANYTAILQRMADQTPGVVFMPRFLSDPELIQLIAAADLVALPYRRTLTSGVLLLALSYARPVLVPDTGPMQEIVEEGVNGFLFHQLEQQSLTTALERAIRHPDLDILGQNGLTTARQFDWDSIAQQTAEVYRQAVMSKG